MREMQAGKGFCCFVWDFCKRRGDGFVIPGVGNGNFNKGHVEVIKRPLCRASNNGQDERLILKTPAADFPGYKQGFIEVLFGSYSSLIRVKAQFCEQLRF
jgi:hypothetical protein